MKSIYFHFSTVYMVIYASACTQLLNEPRKRRENNIETLVSIWEPILAHTPLKRYTWLMTLLCRMSNPKHTYTQTRLWFVYSHGSSGDLRGPHPRRKLPHVQCLPSQSCHTQSSIHAALQIYVNVGLDTQLEMAPPNKIIQNLLLALMSAEITWIQDVRTRYSYETGRFVSSQIQYTVPIKKRAGRHGLSTWRS